MRLKRSLIAAAGVVVASAIAFVIFFAWLGPRSAVQVPGANASPQEVVQAYNDAVNARDFATSNEIDRRPGRGYGWWALHPLRTEDVRFTKTTVDGRRVHVLFTAKLSGGDGSLPAGREIWGYALERGSDDRWHIVDAGVV